MGERELVKIGGDGVGERSDIVEGGDGGERHCEGPGVSRSLKVETLQMDVRMVL